MMKMCKLLFRKGIRAAKAINWLRVANGVMHGWPLLRWLIEWLIANM